MANNILPISESPLQRATSAQLQQLCEVLWSWAQCDVCEKGWTCDTVDCPWKRFKRLGRFFEHYNSLAASYDPDLGPGEVPCIRSHEELFTIIQELKNKPGVTRTELAGSLFGKRTEPSSPADQNQAINLAVKVFATVNCSAQGQSSGLLEHGPHRTPWRNGVAFSQFIEEIFPTTDHPSLNEENSGSVSDIKAQLTAKKLQKRAGLRFRPTDDLRRHLVLDSRNSTVEIFHHTAFLKEHLKLTKNKPNMSCHDSLQM